MTRLAIVEGDITTQAVDAIVNAANSALRGGGGVDGAIHRAAGPELLPYMRATYPSGCPTGDCRKSPGFNLPARLILHCVGPVWQGGEQGEADQLASCYRAALRLAAEEAARTIAFPAISTGVYGYPIVPAALVAVETVRKHGYQGLEEVRFMAFGAEARRAYEAALGNHNPG